jgi:cytochrome b
MPDTNPALTIKVWDPLVRFGHWALVAAFAVAYLSAEEESGGPDQLHVWGGYAIGIIVAIRLLWGVVGSRHARFSDFVYSPSSAVRYLVDLLRGRARRYLGHSPAAGAMVFALLLCLVATVGTGLVAYGDRGKGPLAIAGGVVITQAHAKTDANDAEPGSGEQREDAGSLIGDIHSLLANITLSLVALHILGVALASVVHRENLVEAMISGRKRGGDES